MSYSSFWMIPRRLNLMCRRIKFRRRGITQNKEYNFPNMVKVLKEEYLF